MTESGGLEELVEACAAAMRRGANFPATWRTLLKHHRLIAGPPLQFYDEGRPQLDIPLVTGQRLVFDPTSRTFVVMEA